ncbi:MAG: ADOP family duplicated permease [Verrucomicrobiota bacterium]
MTRKRREQDLDEELRFHIDMSVEKKMASGMSEEEARKEALRDFGGVDLAKERIRDGWVSRYVFGFWRDLKLGWRQMWARKMVAFVIVATLGLAIGSNTAIFSTLNELAIKGLPFEESDRLVEIYNSYGQDELNNEGNNLTHYLMYSEFEDLFESVSLREAFWGKVSWDGNLAQTKTYRVTPEFFDTLKVRPLLGDFFDESHRVEGGKKVAVLSYGFWRSRFGGNADVLGKSISVKEEQFEVIGVAPKEVSDLDTTVGLFTAWQWQEGNVDTAYHLSRHMNYGQLWARLKSDVSTEGLRTRVNAMNAEYFAGLAEADQAMLKRMGHRIGVGSVKDERIRDVKGSLFMLQLAAGLILLIACVNVSNILLARANERQAEFGIRTALGAGRGALLRQVFAELALLSLVACAVGVAAGAGGIHLINTEASGLLPPIEGVSLDGTVLLGTIGFTLFAVVLCGALSSWKVLRANAYSALKGGGRAASASRVSRKASAWLISGQCAAAFAVTVGAGLLWVSMQRAVNLDPGYDSRNVATFRFYLPWTTYERWQLMGFQRQLGDVLRGNPEVEKFAYSANVPSFGYHRSLVYFPDRIFEEALEQPKADMSIVSPGYFDVLGIELLDGRDFTAADIEAQSEPMIVDTRFAEKYFDGKSPLGRKIHLGNVPGEGAEWATIVGVVEAARNLSLDNAEEFPFVYRVLRPRRAREYSVFVKTRTAPERVLEQVLGEVRELDPNLVPFRMGTLDMFLEEALANRKAVLLMIGAFAALALGLSATGIYGALAHDVSQRQKELGIRSALGAEKLELFKSVVWNGVKRVGIGLAIGAALSVALAKFLSEMLFAVRTTEPVVYLGIGCVMLAVGVLASVAPGLRAMRIRALDAMRNGE